MKWMDALDPAFGAIDVKATVSKINLRPAQQTQLLRSQAMTICQQDRCTIPGRVAPSLTCSFNQPINFRFG
jgi:hypothetical protein